MEGAGLQRFEYALPPAERHHVTEAQFIHVARPSGEPDASRENAPHRAS